MSDLESISKEPITTDIESEEIVVVHRWQEKVLEVLARVGTENYAPCQLIDALKLNPKLADLYPKPVGVKERYSLERHTLMMMGQRQKFFPNFASPLLSPQIRELADALHDIGKPIGVERYGDAGKLLQHEFTMIIISEIFEKLEFYDEKSKKVLEAYINQDYIGDYIKSHSRYSEMKIDAWTMAQAIYDRSVSIGASVRDYYDLIKVLYMSDAGSYTLNAGGIESLDFLFEFDDSKLKMDFSAEIKPLIIDLEREIILLEDRDKSSAMQPESEDKVEQNPEIVSQLFSNADLDGLIRNNSQEAQVAIGVIFCNLYENFSLRSLYFIDIVRKINFDSVASSLNISDADIFEIKKQLSEMIEFHSNLKSTEKEIEKISGWIKYEYDEDRRDSYIKQINELTIQNKDIESKLYLAYSKLTFPLRRAILSGDFSSEYKCNVVIGLKSDKKGDFSEFELLKKNFYSIEDQEFKNVILQTVFHNLPQNIELITMFTLEDFEKCGIDLDKLFLSVMGHQDATFEIIRDKISPHFFPEEDSTKIAKTWVLLRNISNVDSSKPDTSFYSNGSNNDPRRMDRVHFLELSQHYDELSPVISLLSEYGFQYSAFEPIMGFNDNYLKHLLELSANIEELSSELKVAKKLNPDFKYLYTTAWRNRLKRVEREQYLSDNPFVMAFEQRYEHIPSQVEDENSLKEFVDFCHQILNEVTTRWRASFLEFYIKKLCQVVKYSSTSQFISEELMMQVNAVINDEAIEHQELERIATEYFSAAVLPSSKSVKQLFNFLDLYADKVETWHEVEDGWETDADATWLKFCFHYSDIYRYTLDDLDDHELDKTKEIVQYDHAYILGAISRINNPLLRDKAIENVIIALTDDVLGDLEVAKRLQHYVESDASRERVDEEISLEEERIARGDGISWKKVEKVRRKSQGNVAFLLDLYGFTSQDKLEQATKRWIKISPFWPPYLGTFSQDRLDSLYVEAQKVHDSFRVTVNVAWDNIKQIFDSGKLKSVWERIEVAEERTKRGKFGDYAKKRDSVERQMGNRAKGGSKDPHPIYGAAYSENGRDEFFGGVGKSGYGDCFIKLKSDRIKDRTSFVFDDSFDGYTDWMVDWTGGQIFKAIHNVIEFNTKAPYVEAQILGGVTIDDIDSIHIPDFLFDQKNESGDDIGPIIKREISELEARFPDIKFIIVESPKEI